MFNVLIVYNNIGAFGTDIIAIKEGQREWRTPPRASVRCPCAVVGGAVTDAGVGAVVLFSRIGGDDDVFFAPEGFL